ncbi:unnamed protein product, partial [Nesidiocoris tenuis]
YRSRTRPSVDSSQRHHFGTDRKRSPAHTTEGCPPDAICCSNVGPSSWPFVSTVRNLEGSTIPTNRPRSGVVTFGGVPVETCDVIARDGIIHVIDGV